MRVDAVSKVADLELAEKEKMKDKVEKILKHKCSVFINRYVISLIITCLNSNYCTTKHEIFCERTSPN